MLRMQQRLPVFGGSYISAGLARGKKDCPHTFPAAQKWPHPGLGRGARDDFPCRTHHWSGRRFCEMLRNLVERLPVMITPRWVETRSQPIAVDDVIRYLVRALERPESVGRTRTSVART